MSGVTLTDTVGAQGIGFTASRTDFRYAFGYPAARPYDGSDLIHCAGTHHRRPVRQRTPWGWAAT